VIRSPITALSRTELEIVSRRDMRRWSCYAVCTLGVFAVCYGSALLYHLGAAR
jgi:hypothetical protein